MFWNMKTRFMESPIGWLGGCVARRLPHWA